MCVEVVKGEEKEDEMRALFVRACVHTHEGTRESKRVCDSFRHQADGGRRG